MEPVTLSVAQVVIIVIISLIVGATLGIFALSICFVGRDEREEMGVQLSQRDEDDAVPAFAQEVKSRIELGLRRRDEAYLGILHDVLAMCDRVISSTWR